MKKYLLPILSILFLPFFSTTAHAQEAPGLYEPDSTLIGSVVTNKAAQFTVSNYPNPVVSSTTVRYNVPENSIITLKIYTTGGHEVATLFYGLRKTGSYSAEFDAGNISGGTYVCALSYTSNNKHLFTSQKYT